MEEERPGKDPRQEFRRQVDARRKRKLRSLEQGDKSVWFGIGMFGLVGWAVAIPTLLGIAAGIWLDTHTRGAYSWTLMMLLIGVGAGCFNAWYWLQKERRRVERELGPPPAGGGPDRKERP
ncbi:MAG: AtpZ/AtpI family protein [Deltaproteobacteria bacterium]|nr:AtpZ/AtpI family protein [Deltaproteobacteria bacterium]